MAWGVKEVVNGNRPNVTGGERFSRSKSETVRVCMARQQGTLAACGASGCQHLVCGYYLKQQPAAGLVCVKEDVSDRCCQTSELLIGCFYATSVHPKHSIKSFGKAGWHTTH